MRPLPSQVLTDWWLAHAASEVDLTIPKMNEYGSRDLVEVGQQLARIARREIDELTAMEWGCAFYLLGKMARVTSAMERGDRPSDDTWFDISVYARMVQAARAGAWRL